MKKYSFEKKLNSYVALATAFLTAKAAEVDAQIIYKDINPDDSISYSFFNLDLNNDGVADFKLNERSFQIVYLSWGSYTIFDNSIIPYLNNNLLAQSGLNKVAMLNFGDSISPNNIWITNEWLLAGTNGEPWTLNQEGFVGLKFFIGSNNYYGWARIEITLDELILKDYAYNPFPNQPILAGEGIVISVPELLNDNTISIYPNPTNDKLTIQFNTSLNNSSVILSNSLGEIVKSEIVLNKILVMDIKKIPTGIYFLKVVNENGSVTKKIVIAPQ